MATRKKTENEPTIQPEAKDTPTPKAPPKKRAPAKPKAKAKAPTKSTAAKRSCRGNIIKFDPSKLSKEQHAILNEYKICSLSNLQGNPTYNFKKGEYINPDNKLLTIVAEMTSRRMPLSKQQEVLGIDKTTYAKNFADIYEAFRFPSPQDKALVVRMSAIGLNTQHIADSLNVSRDALERNCKDLILEGKLETYRFVQAKAMEKIEEGYWPAIEHYMKTRGANLESDYYVSPERQATTQNIVLTIGNQTVQSIENKYSGSSLVIEVQDDPSYDEELEFQKMLELARDK